MLYLISNFLLNRECEKFKGVNVTLIHMLFLHFSFVLKNRILELELWKFNLKKPKAYAVKFIHMFLNID